MAYYQIDGRAGPQWIFVEAKGFVGQARDNEERIAARTKYAQIFEGTAEDATIQAKSNLKPLNYNFLSSGLGIFEGEEQRQVQPGAIGQTTVAGKPGYFPMGTFRDFLKEKGMRPGGVLGSILEQQGEEALATFNPLSLLGMQRPEAVTGYTDVPTQGFRGFLEKQGLGGVPAASEVAFRALARPGEGGLSEDLQKFAQGGAEGFGQAELFDLFQSAAASRFSPTFARQVLPGLLSNAARERERQLAVGGTQPTYAGLLASRYGF
jgi:hypothetical protein